MVLSKSKQFQVVLAATLGGILEWYEFFLYIYWSPIIAELFFNSTSPTMGLINALFIFFIGFLARPFGGLIFGYFGDRYGRKLSFLATIVLLTIPNIAIAFIPTYAQIGVAAPVILAVLRFLQGIPVGGEIPGAICYLYESSFPNRKRFNSSFSYFGPQIGIIISLLECFYLEKHLSPEHLIDWGWRLSFASSGLFGLAGFFLRLGLKETPSFKQLEMEKKVLHNPTVVTLKRHKKEIVLGFSASIAEAVGFYMFSVFSGLYFVGIGTLNKAENIAITVSVLAFSSIMILVFGRIGDKYKIKRLLMGSSLAIVVLSVILYFLNAMPNRTNIFIFEMIFMALLAVQTALLPSLLCDLYPSTVRYSCIGLSSNLCDSIIGGLTPIATFYLMRFSANANSFMLIIIIAFLISLIPFSLIKYRDVV